HKVIAEYDDRAGAEKLIAEAHAEGLSAIPSKRFERNRAFFQIAMFSYNLWRHLKAFANEKAETAWRLNTNATSRLRLLLLAAKVNFHSERTEIKYSTYLLVKPTLDHLFQRLDHLRTHREIWRKSPATTAKNSLRPREQDRAKNFVHDGWLNATFDPRHEKLERSESFQEIATAISMRN
ncbi:MAG: transposase, partial [bacterium]